MIRGEGSQPPLPRPTRLARPSPARPLPAPPLLSLSPTRPSPAPRPRRFLPVPSCLV